MMYKGHYLDDNIFNQEKVERISLYSGVCDNEVSLTEEDLTSLIERLKEKERYLKNCGIEFNNLHYEIGGKEFRYNPNGADEVAEYYCNLCWNEKEPEEQYNERMAKQRETIDEIVMKEEEEKEIMRRRDEDFKRQSIQAAISLIEESGGTVTLPKNKKNQKKIKRNEKFNKNR